MSRFLVVCCFLFGNGLLFGQNEFRKFSDFADEQYNSGNYSYALNYFNQAMAIDSSNCELLWKISLCHQALKNYPTAASYFSKVYAKEEGRIYPTSLLNWALMEKQSGNYEKAIELLKIAKKKYAKDKKDYTYFKAKREFESCLWAQTAKKDTTDLATLSFAEKINTPFSEFGHTIANNTLYFSSLRADSSSTSDEIFSNNYSNKLFYYSLDKTETIPIKALNKTEEHVSNGSFSLDGKRFYFSKCKQDSSAYNCKIYCAKKNEETWNDSEELGEIINTPAASTSMPSIGEINGQEVLFYCSNKVEGKGGFDIYYSLIKQNGNQYSKPKALSSINSPDNEVTPWFNNTTKTLYFASSWWDGFGGLDVFSTVVHNDFKVGVPVNKGLPINSCANDNYYFESTDSLFVSSNRLGALYTNIPTCCSDIFAFQHPKVTIPPTKKETFITLNKRLPVTLYFHNDVPNPRSTEQTTTINYATTYTEYSLLAETYKKEYTKGLTADAALNAEEDIESFFTEYVAKGVRDLALFNDLLAQELEKGNHIQLNVRGFASPLAKTDYNINLTKRRIQSLVNELKVYKNGQLLPYLNGTAFNGARLIINEIPTGEYAANKLTSDNPNDTKNSIYSRAAAIERKIEIQSVEELQRHPMLDSLQFNQTIIYLKNQTVKPDQPVVFQLYNQGKNKQTISRIELSSDLLSYTGATSMKAKSNHSLTFLFNQPPKEKFTCTIKVYIENCSIPLILGIMGD